MYLYSTARNLWTPSNPKILKVIAKENIEVESSCNGEKVAGNTIVLFGSNHSFHFHRKTPTKRFFEEQSYRLSYAKPLVAISVTQASFTPLQKSPAKASEKFFIW